MGCRAWGGASSAAASTAQGEDQRSGSSHRCQRVLSLIRAVVSSWRSFLDHNVSLAVVSLDGPRTHPCADDILPMPLCGPVNAGNWMVDDRAGSASLSPEQARGEKSPHAPGTLHVATRIASHRCEVAAPLACADPQTSTMLSQLIERFIKRLCGRWLRGFDGSQVNVSLGGTVTLEHLDLKTEELRALYSPYEPVSASVRRLRLEIDPLSSSLRVDVENVDVALTARSAFDAADARDAVERAVHLYFHGPWRPPKQSNTNDAGAAALRDLLKSSEVVLRRLHVRVAQCLPLRAAGGRPRAACPRWACFWKRSTCGAPRATCTNV